MLIEKRAGEDQEFPTLACEGLQARDNGGVWGELRAAFVEAWEIPRIWESRTRELLERTGRIQPVEVVDGVLILERAPVAIKVWGGSEPEVWIEIMPRSKPATPEEVASSYERAMQEQAVGFHEDRAISMDCILTEHHLRLILKPVFVGMYISDRPPREPFPSPALVEDSCRGHLEGSMGKRLKARVRGGPWKPDNLVPAIVAFFLRTYGGMDGRKEINRLLNEHVLRDTGCSDRQGHRVSPLW